MTGYGYAVATVNAEGEVRTAVRLPSWVLSSGGASSSERMVAVALAALEAGHAVPSMAWIAGKSGLSKRTVRRVLARLRADGRVCVRPRFDVVSGARLCSEYVLAE